MTDELHAEVVAPKQRRRVIAIVAAVCLLAIGALTTVLWLPQRTRTVVIEAPPIHEIEQVPVPVMVEPPPPPPPPTTDVAIVFTAGGDTYLELDAFELPKHGKPRLLEDGPITAIADVAVKNLPADLRAWKKRTVTVDGNCEARVTGFAVIARLDGNPRDVFDVAPDEEPPDWTANNVMEHGAPVLAARLDGCSGTFARDASLPAITVLTDMDSPGDVAERALEQFIASDLVGSAQTEWHETGNDGNWYEGEDARLETHVMRHPATGVVWVVIHAYRFNDCGAAGGDALGMYRVETDGSLTTVRLRGGGADRIDHIIDLEADGELELVTSTQWTTSIDRANGDTVRSLGVALFGCRC
jgi:hypothetical protein